MLTEDEYGEIGGCECGGCPYYPDCSGCPSNVINNDSNN